MFNFKNRKRFSEDLLDLEAESQDVAVTTQVEESATVQSEAAEPILEEPEQMAEEGVIQEQSEQEAAEAAESVAEPVSEPEKPVTAESDSAEEAAEPAQTAEEERSAKEQLFDAYRDGDFPDFNPGGAFDAFNGAAYGGEEPAEAAATTAKPQSLADEEAFSAEGAEQVAEQPQAETRGRETADEAELSESTDEPPIKPQPAAETDEETAQQNAFNPAEYAVDLNFQDQSVFETAYQELSEEDLSAYIETMRNMIRMMALNTNHLIGLIQRKNKRLNQYEDIAKLLENNQRDFENYKRRNAELESKALEEGYAKALGAVLPTLDNFDRAVAMIPDPQTAEGVVMIQRQLQNALEKLGVEEIVAEGQEFDPNFHNAVMQQETDDESLSDKVVEVFQKGYLCGDKVLRYAQVKVAKKY